MLSLPSWIAEVELSLTFVFPIADLTAILPSQLSFSRQGIIASSFSVVEVQWSCRDDVGDAAWQHDDSGAQTNVPGGSTLEFTLSVSVPSDLEVGVKCTALIVADEVSSLTIDS